MYTGKGKGGGQQHNTGKGQGKDTGLGQCDMSDVSRFLNQLHEAVEKHCPVKMPADTDPVAYFLDICDHVDNWDQSATDNSNPERTWLEGVRPDAFNPLLPACPATNKFGSNAWATQLAALLRMLHGPAAYGMRQHYMTSVLEIGDPSKEPVRVRISGLPPNLTLSIFQFFFKRMARAVSVSEAVQVTQAAQLDDKVSYVLTLERRKDQDPKGAFAHVNLIMLMYSFHLQQVDWPGATDKLCCQPELLHGKIPAWLRPGLQAELYIAAIGIANLTIEGLINYHAKDHENRHDVFNNNLGLLVPGAWSRVRAADAIWNELQETNVFTLLPGEDSATTVNPTARWWDDVLVSWVQNGGDRPHHCDV